MPGKVDPDSHRLAEPNERVSTGWWASHLKHKPYIGGQDSELNNISVNHPDPSVVLRKKSSMTCFFILMTLC